MKKRKTLKTKYLPVAQLDSASDSDSEGPRFESAQVGQVKRSILNFGIDLFLFNRNYVDFFITLNTAFAITKLIT